MGRDAPIPRKRVREPGGRRLAELAREWRLTPRQSEVLRLLARGKANKEIAQTLRTSVKTVEVHVTQVLRKAAAASRSELTARFWAWPGEGQSPPAARAS